MAMVGQLAPGTRLRSDVPPRLDRLPWSGWHWRIVLALGITWVLDGLEVTVVGAVSSVLAEPGTLALSERQIGLAGSAYLVGAISGALLFGRLTDRLGRKRLFLVTLGLYLASALLTALAWDFASFAIFRALTGAAIGGEYAAINSAVDELLPARLRGQCDLAINGSYWAGTLFGAMITLPLLDPRLLPHSIGWRLAFGLGVLLGGAVILVRRHVPESPRWLLLHGHISEAERVVAQIEHEVAGGHSLPHPGHEAEIVVRGSVTFSWIAQVLLAHHLKRSILGLVLMLSQAFAYNAIFFTYALVLSRFYGVPASRAGLYLIPFAIGNLLGPFLLGPLFDSVGRRVMIALTYGLAGALLLATGYAFWRGWLNATTQTLLWSAVFFVASAAASSAYLTVSELFPVELRGMAIALFYAAGTAAGGAFAPALFGVLIQSGDRSHVFGGYILGAALMLAASATAAILGVDAEGRSLEALAEHERA